MRASLVIYLLGHVTPMVCTKNVNLHEDLNIISLSLTEGSFTEADKLHTPNYPSVTPSSNVPVLYTFNPTCRNDEEINNITLSIKTTQ